MSMSWYLRSQYIQCIQFFKQEVLFLFQVLHYFPRAAITKYQKLGDLKQQEFIGSHFWRIEIQNQGISRQGHALSDSSRGESFLSPSQLLVFATNLWCSLVCKCITPIFCLSKYPLLIRTPFILDDICL